MVADNIPKKQSLAVNVLFILFFGPCQSSKQGPPKLCRLHAPSCAKDIYNGITSDRAQCGQRVEFNLLYLLGEVEVHGVRTP